MEHGWYPTSSPRRTPMQIAGRFAVLLDFRGFLILDQPPECYGTWLVSDQLPSSDTLEPTTKVLWNMGCSDQPTSSDTLEPTTKVLWNMGVSTSPDTRAHAPSQGLLLMCRFSAAG